MPQIGDTVRHLVRDDLGEGWIVEEVDEDRFLIEWSKGIVLRNKKEKVAAMTHPADLVTLLADAIQGDRPICGEDAADAAIAALDTHASWLARQPVAGDEELGAVLYHSMCGEDAKEADWLICSLFGVDSGEEAREWYVDAAVAVRQSIAHRPAFNQRLWDEAIDSVPIPVDIPMEKRGAWSRGYLAGVETAAHLAARPVVPEWAEHVSISIGAYRQEWMEGGQPHHNWARSCWGKGPTLEAAISDMMGKSCVTQGDWDATLELNPHIAAAVSGEGEAS